MLLSHKTANLYAKCLEIVKIYCQRVLNVDLNPSYILTDFEFGMKKALATTFPNSKKKGCLFHFKQIIYRRVQRMGLQPMYGSDLECSRQVKLLMALPYLQPENVKDAFNEIKRVGLAILEPLCNWLEANYINGTSKRYKEMYT